MREVLNLHKKIPDQTNHPQDNWPDQVIETIDGTVERSDSQIISPDKRAFGQLLLIFSAFPYGFSCSESRENAYWR